MVLTKIFLCYLLFLVYKSIFKGLLSHSRFLAQCAVQRADATSVWIWVERQQREHHTFFLMCENCHRRLGLDIMCECAASEAAQRLYKQGNIYENHLCAFVCMHACVCVRETHL